jgi:hypothetical protein
VSLVLSLVCVLLLYYYYTPGTTPNSRTKVRYLVTCTNCQGSFFTNQFCHHQSPAHHCCQSVFHTNTHITHTCQPTESSQQPADKRNKRLAGEIQQKSSDLNCQSMELQINHRDSSTDINHFVRLHPNTARRLFQLAQQSQDLLTNENDHHPNSSPCWSVHDEHVDDIQFLPLCLNALERKNSENSWIYCSYNGGSCTEGKGIMFCCHIKERRLVYVSKCKGKTNEESVVCVSQKEILMPNKPYCCLPTEAFSFCVIFMIIVLLSCLCSSSGNWQNIINFAILCVMKPSTERESPTNR